MTARSPVTILVADDDDDSRSGVRQVLAAEGYRVIEVADGAQVLQLLARAEDGGEGHPDVMLLDFVMPGYSGLGILRATHLYKRRPPIIIMTGFPDPAVERLALGLGARRVLRKPIDVDALIAAIREALPA